MSQLNFTEQQFLEYLYGKEKAEILLQEADPSKNYYRKVYNNWLNGKKYTWNFAAFFIITPWMIYRGMFLYAFVYKIFESLFMIALSVSLLLGLSLMINLEANLGTLIGTIFTFAIIEMTASGILGNSLLKYRVAKLIQNGNFDSVKNGSTPIFVTIICSMLSFSAILLFIPVLICHFYYKNYNKKQVREIP